MKTFILLSSLLFAASPASAHLIRSHHHHHHPKIKTHKHYHTHYKTGVTHFHKHKHGGGHGHHGTKYRHSVPTWLHIHFH